MNATRFRSVAVTGLFAVACGIALGQLSNQSQPSAAQHSTLEWLAQPRLVADFTLTSVHGAMTASALQGHWQFLVLAFTHCPDLCPTTLAQLAELRATLADEPLRVILVSVDPKRDSPELLAAYAQFYGPDVIGITGAPDQLRRLANSLGMDFRVGDSNNDISHSPTIALIGPDGMMRGRLQPGFDITQAARELSARMKAAL